VFSWVAVQDQLRIYTIKPGEMADWLQEWRATVLPLRVKLGFVVLGPWVIEEQNLFVWILRYAGPGSFDEADAAYYESAERKTLDPDPARHLARTEHRMMVPAG
jgi:hypothetical protein